MITLPKCIYLGILAWKVTFTYKQNKKTDDFFFNFSLVLSNTLEVQGDYSVT